jgi:hypothetical protein
MKTRACIFGFMCVLLMGCSELPSIGLHTPGEYSGKQDPLLAVAGTPEHEARLQARFQQVQTDR